MKCFFLALMLALLSGCVTIHQVPSEAKTAPPPVLPTPVQVVEVCHPYEPPTRRKIPSVPDIGEPKGDYVKYLEEAADQLVDHIQALRLYIANEHKDEDDAMRRHNRDCQKL